MSTSNRTEASVMTLDDGVGERDRHQRTVRSRSTRAAAALVATAVVLIGVVFLPSGTAEAATFMQSPVLTCWDGTPTRPAHTGYLTGTSSSPNIVQVRYSFSGYRGEPIIAVGQAYKKIGSTWTPIGFQRAVVNYIPVGGDIISFHDAFRVADGGQWAYMMVLRWTQNGVTRTWSGWALTPSAGGVCSF